MSVLECATARAVLKARTDAIHQRLEAVPVMADLLHGRIERCDYAQLLDAYRRFYASAASHLEIGYAQLRRVGFLLAPKNPLDMLDDDLAHVAPDVPGSRLPDAVAPTTPQHAVGWVWVVEGSVLGGRVIDGALNRLFGDRREGRRFFEAAPDMASRWKSICHAIEAYGHSEDVAERMADGAVAAFECIERCLLGIQR